MGVIDRYVNNISRNISKRDCGFEDKKTYILDKMHGHMGTFFEVSADGSNFNGLDEVALSKIRLVIKNYISNVQQELSKLSIDDVKGVKVCDDYIKAIDDLVAVYLSSLSTYSDKMYKHVNNK